MCVASTSAAVYSDGGAPRMVDREDLTVWDSLQTGKFIKRSSLEPAMKGSGSQPLERPGLLEQSALLLVIYERCSTAIREREREKLEERRANLPFAFFANESSYESLINLESLSYTCDCFVTARYYLNAGERRPFTGLPLSH